MNRQYLKYVSFLLMILSVVACSMAKPNQKPLRDKAAALGLVEAQKRKLDLSFYSPSKSIKNNSAIYLEPLNFSEVKIIRSSSHTVFDTPWELNDKDRSYYQEKFSNAADRSFINSGTFKIAMQKGEADLILRTKIIEIAPLGSKDDFVGRPQRVKVYTEGFGTMTIVFEFYDAKTNELIATQLDEHELGTIWEENNRVQNNIQIKLAFDYWLNALATELKLQTKS